MEDLKLDDFFQQGGRRFIKAADIKGPTAKAVITNVRSADLKNSGLTPILDVEVKKIAWSFPLNKTNFDKCIELFGPKSSKWIGKVITFFKVLVNDPKKQKEVEGLRIK
jgi:hypothetical protein